jgi:primosomal protein N' (replication factor Y)
MRGKKAEVISERLKVKLAATVEDGNQAILFLNRRGFSNSIICRDCGFTFSCLNCSVTLTLHKGRGALVCHYCDFTLKVPDECPECASINLINPGAGTEKVEEEVKALIATARVVRMDRDTTALKGAAKRILDAVEAGEADVLVGTQMVSKGHHFPGIGLVGIISGDTSLNIPDFRSAERTFQLVTQAAGRAGRGSIPGSVLIQTLNPDHPCFKSALTHDYEAFYAEEINNRDELSYPPFTRLCSLRVEGQGEGRTEEAAMILKSFSDKLLPKKPGAPVVLGPAPALLAKLKGRYRWQLLVKGADVKELHSFVRRLKHAFEAKGPKSITLGVDMDPLSIV